MREAPAVERQGRAGQGRAGQGRGARNMDMDMDMDMEMGWVVRGRCGGSAGCRLGRGEGW